MRNATVRLTLAVIFALVLLAAALVLVWRIFGQRASPALEGALFAGLQKWEAIRICA